MVALLEIPTPRGDLGQMRQSASLLDRYARDIDHGSADLARIDAMVGSEWLGESADAFALQSVQARRALTAIAGTHRETAVVIRQYAEQWEHTRRLSEQTRSEVSQALDTYGKQAHSAVSGLMSVLQRAESNAVVDKITDVVTDVVSVVAPDLGRFIDKLQNWSPPTRRPHIYILPHDHVDPIQVETVLGTIRDGAEWGISHLLHGIEAVADFVGHMVGNAISLFKRLEEWLANAIARARKILKSAFDTLFALGRKAAAAIARVAVAAVKAAYEFAATVVRAGVDFLITVGKAVKAVIDFGVQVIAWGGKAALDLASKMADLMGRRRLSPFDRAVLDARAQAQWLRDKAYRKQVEDYLRLADNAYIKGTEKLPPGWTGEVHDGPDGFSVTVYKGPNGETVLAFRGSQLKDGGVTDMEDWKQDGMNAAGLETSQARQAIEFTKQYLRDHPNEPLHLTGHSLGGSLAAVASLATGVGATTFNAAGVGQGNYDLAMREGGYGRGEGQITNFHTPTDAATAGQHLVDVDAASGAQVTLDYTGIDPMSAHQRPDLYQGMGVKA